MTCRECWEDPCTCEPEPLRDFENGYCTELAPRWPTPADWSERANAWPFNADIYLRARFAGFNERIADVLTRESPVMMRLGTPHPLVVTPVEYAELDRELRGVRTTPAEDALFRPRYDGKAWGGNRATRRARKAMAKRARR